jgi:hypothetical protein
VSGLGSQPNCAKRLECAELAPAFESLVHYDSASKLVALQTLRVAVRCGSTRLRSTDGLSDAIPLGLMSWKSVRTPLAAELREAFGVRGACSRFRIAGALRQRQQAGRTPNASRGSSLRLDEAAFKRQVDLAGDCPIPGQGCVARCLGLGSGRAGRGRGGGNAGGFVATAGARTAIATAVAPTLAAFVVGLTRFAPGLTSFAPGLASLGAG